MQGLTPFEQIAIWSVLGVAILGLAYAWFLRSQIMREDKGTEKMQEVWGAIRDGADAYLGQQLKSILPLIGILTVALFFSVYIVPPSPEAQQRFPGMDDSQLRLLIGFARAIAFVMGAGFSLTVGQIGMRMAVQGNVRVASASRRSFADPLRIAYRTGTITGMLTDGLGLFGGTIIFIIPGSAVRGGPGKGGDAMAAIFRGFLSSAVISAVLFFIGGFIYMNKPEMDAWGGWWRTPMTVAVGVVLAILIDRLTEYFTGTDKAPVLDIKKAADTGPATLILQGVAVGFESSVWSVLVIAVTIIASIFIMGTIPGLDAGQRVSFILYGVAMTGIGMLTLTGNNVAMDSFGPIADNANGIGEMSWSGMEDKETREAQQIMADLDGVGNTTKAITKGVAIGSAVIAPVSLFGSFLVDVSRAPTSLGIPVGQQIQAIGIRVDIPQVFVGMLVGGALPWLFSSFAIQAVSRAAALIVQECRRQFRLGVLEGKVKPDYAKAVSISTTAAQQELIVLE